KETGVSWRIGAEGEEVTAELLTPLRRQGWYWLHDRAVPTRRFNLDHLGVPPSGQELTVVETKKWPRTWQVSVDDRGRLVCGPTDRPGPARLQEKDVDALINETDAILPHTDLPVTRFIAVHGARVAGGHLTLTRPSPVLGADVTITVVEAPLLPSTLVVHAAGEASPAAARRTAEWASGRFPRR